MFVNLKLKFKLSLVYWLNLTQFKIESKISFLNNFLKIFKGLAKFFYHKSPNHVQIPDLGHFLENIITLLNLYLVLILEQSIVRAHLLDAKFLFWSWWRSALNEINDLALYLWKISGLALLQHNKHTYILKNAQFIGVFSSKKSYLSIVTSCKRSKRKVNMRQIINYFLYWSWFYQSFLTSF